MVEHKFSEELDLAKRAAYEVGKLQLRYFEGNLQVIRKAPKELVSDADMACQELSHDLLTEAFPYPVLSEEVRNVDVTTQNTFWVVDPVDGTHNFIAGLPLFGVSIALVSGRQFVVGAIYLPFFDKLFYAAKEQGAYMNGIRIHVSGNEKLEKSMITYDNQFHLSPHALKRYEVLTKSVFTTRILGSAIYDFTLIASAKIDARVWNKTKLVDIAAGSVIVEEAGGRVTDFQGSPVTLSSHQEVIASNYLVHDELIAILNESN